MSISLNQEWTYSKPLVFSTRSLGFIRYNRPLHPTPSPHFLVRHMRQCSHLVPVISILQVLFCPLSRQPFLFTASFLWCSPGSVLGPILFIMYTTPLSSLISQTSACHKSQVDHHLYADDTQLFISFSPHAAQAALDSLHVTLAAISQWMASNFLTLNPSKTEFLIIIIGLPTQLSKLQSYAKSYTS